MLLRNAEVIKHRAALRPMFYSKIVNGKLYIGDLEKLWYPHKLVVVGETPRALASRIFEPPHGSEIA